MPWHPIGYKASSSSIIIWRSDNEVYTVSRDHSGYWPSQCHKALHFYAFCHWPFSYSEWSLSVPCMLNSRFVANLNRSITLSVRSLPLLLMINLMMIGDGGGRPSSVMSLGVTSVGGHSHGHPASPIGVGSSWEDIDPRSLEPLVVRGVGSGWSRLYGGPLRPCTSNLIPPSSFAVSCDLKALWPGVLGCWGIGGRCTTWPINP